MGVDVNCRDMQGRVPLWLSTRYNDHEVTDLLLAKESLDLNIAACPKSRQNVTPTTPLWNAISNAADCDSEAISVAKLLLKRKSLNPNFVTNNGYTPLGIAARYGMLEVLELFLDRSDTRLNPTMSHEVGPLYEAVIADEAGSVRLLAEQGDRLCLDAQRDIIGIAVRCGNKEIIDILTRAKDASEKRRVVFQSRWKPLASKC